MNIDEIAEEAKFCKETGKPIIDGKCVCSGKPVEKQCSCQSECHHIDIRSILPFIIQIAESYKGLN